MEPDGLHHQRKKPRLGIAGPVAGLENGTPARSKRPPGMLPRTGGSVDGRSFRLAAVIPAVSLIGGSAFVALAVRNLYVACIPWGLWPVRFAPVKRTLAATSCEAAFGPKPASRS